jgi:hypothetical protein
VSAPTQIATVEAGKQASGMAINRAGTLALVANRADDSVTVLTIDGKDVVVDAASVGCPRAAAQKGGCSIPRSSRRGRHSCTERKAPRAAEEPARKAKHAA